MKVNYLAGSIFAGIVVGLSLASLARSGERESSASSRFASKPPSSRQQDVGAAMQQANQIMHILQVNNWDIAAVPESLRRLADQDLAETEWKRSRGHSFSLHDSNHPTYGDDVAFFSRTYVRQNLHGDPNATEKTSASPSGFFIVGYRTGEVVQVPVAQVRIKRATRFQSNGTYEYIFPGMGEYASSTLKYPGIL